MPAGSTLTQNVYQRLRADLLACRLMPGQKLKIEELCERLSAGSSAVREALSRLAARGNHVKPRPLRMPLRRDQPHRDRILTVTIVKQPAIEQDAQARVNALKLPPGVKTEYPGK